MFHKSQSGKLHANPQQMKHMERSGKEESQKDPGLSDGTESPEAETNDAPSHLEEMHAKMGGKHMHVHQSEDGKITSHHIGEDGMVEGPTEHPDMEAMKAHMDSWGGGSAHEMPGMPKHEGGLHHALSGM